MIPGARLICSAGRVRVRARSACACRATTSCRTSPPATCCAPPSRGHRARPHGQEGHGRRWPGRRRHHDRHRRRAAQPPRRHAPRLHPRRLPAHGVQAEALDEIDRRAADRPGHRPRRARASSCSARCSAAGCAATAARTTWPPGRASRRGSATSAAATSCTATTTPPRRSTHRLDLYEQQTAPLIEYYAEPGPAGSRSTGSARPTRSSHRLVAAVDAAHALDGGVRCAVRSPRRTAESCARCARPAGSWPRCTRRSARRCAPGRHHRRARPDRPRRARPPWRHVELPRLPRLPGGDLRVAERRDRPRHPRAARRSHEGDIISIDCGAIVDGWHGDAAFTDGHRARSTPRRSG